MNYLRKVQMFRESRWLILCVICILLPANIGIAQANRDLSTPATRLVGHWVTPGNTHYYFSAADSLTDIGSLTWVEVGAGGRVVKHNYKIIAQTPKGNELTLQILFAAGGSRVDQYIVAKDGKSIHRTITVVGITTTEKLTYVDNQIRPM